MPAQYESCFIINGDGGGVNLLRDVTGRISTELMSSAPDADSPDVETGATDAAAYTRISAERNYPGDAQYRVRLEVRLCTRGDALAAEVHSRFIAADEAAPPELLAGPPRILRFIASEFRCAAGSEPLVSRHRTVAAEDVETFARESLLNPRRRLPILAISQDRQGRLPLEPERAQRALLGVAAVTVLDGDAATALTRFVTGRWFSCFNGAIQILWPGCRYDANGDGPRVYYGPRTAGDADAAGLLRELQRVCIDNAPESDFDSAFSEARVSVILERNRLLETRQQILSGQPDGDLAAETAALKRELRKQEIAAREAGRKRDNALSTVAKLEQELAAAYRRIDELGDARPAAQAADDDREVVRGLRAENRQLREERDRLRDTNAKLNDDNQLLRQRERRHLGPDEAYVIRLAYPHPGNVTILNYALNLFRDPMRQYIINCLDAADDDGLREILRMSVEFNPGAREKPAALIDVNHFHNIVTDNRSYFDNSRNLAWNLRQIRDVRNRAAHPPPGGVSDDFMQDGLSRIAEALETIGARQELMEVVRLRDRVHSN